MVSFPPEEDLADYKLCSFLCTVLSVSSPHTDLLEALPFGTRCHIYGKGHDVCFRTSDGVELYPVGSSSAKTALDPENESRLRDIRMRRRRSIGMVHGSVSVVHQLHVLVSFNCLKIAARVIKVVRGERGKVRAVVLIDIHLPIALWSGWQFPRSGSIAASLFRHISYDWKKRSSFLGNDAPGSKDDYWHDKSIWNLSCCHVLGCNLHHQSFYPSNRKPFKLHEIFKSLPGIARRDMTGCSRVKPAVTTSVTGIWELSDDVLINILSVLGPLELVRVSATCRHLKLLATPIMPCMNVKLFPHQQAAVDWMLQRERNSEPLPHPLYKEISTEDGFSFYINIISGEMLVGLAPVIRDFRGGMFCDEPGLGKTVTALSLILKTQGTLADPPDETEVIWCIHSTGQKCGYYEISSNHANNANIFPGRSGISRRIQLSLNKIAPVTPKIHSSKQAKMSEQRMDVTVSSIENKNTSSSALSSARESCLDRFPRRLNRVKRNLTFSYEKSSSVASKRKNVVKPLTFNSNGSLGDHVEFFREVSNISKGTRKPVNACDESKENWVQCDACHKWRKLPDEDYADPTIAWFCRMNNNPLYQTCDTPEESWDSHEDITCLPGFYSKEDIGGKEKNVVFFTSILKAHYDALMDSETKKALIWLASLSPGKLSEMGTIGLVPTLCDTRAISTGSGSSYHKLFQAFGLVRRTEKGICRWYYPQRIRDLVFDLVALWTALGKPLDSIRLYLSRATLVVVPSNLVDHWETQIQKHVRPGQLRVYSWSDHRKPCAHNLAWDYDVVITTFSRLSVEWSPRKRSALMEVHWRRIILDEGHTLGSSLSLTNKLQMAVSLTASSRWILTGTPTPNTPNDQPSHLQPILKFLHEKAYGEDHKSWEAAILRPFEAELEEGRERLLQLLSRCMISARKTDLQMIPPCIKRVKFVSFTEEHAKSYNELVVTIRRNILMADWSDPSHVESLLNPKQWKFRSATIRNVRLSCCVAGHIKVMDAGQDIQETMDILVDSGLNPTSEDYSFIKCNLLYGGDCQRCKEWCRLPVITPCRHLLCLDCVALDSERCALPGCSRLYEMQMPEELARLENPNPKWPVPKDLIELQPSYKQDDWDSDWQSTSSSKVSYLVERLKSLSEANEKIVRPMGERDDRVDMDGPRCGSSISRASPCNDFRKVHVEKVIIFSQFLEHIHVIEKQLSIAGIKFVGMYSPMVSINKAKSLAIFQQDASCMALVMDGSAALGLDLSFVTHVFLMEPIWDRSVEEQVISRAHRMGASRPVYVETLAMRGTIEEQMLEFLQDADECTRVLKEELVKPEQETSRIHRSLHDFAERNYLAHLNFVRTGSKT